MKHVGDLRSLLFVLLTISLYILAISNFIAWSFYPAWLILAGFLSFQACIINHNHVHQPIFHREHWNILFSCLLSIAKGHSSSTVFVPHNLNHHRHQGGPEDWVRPNLVAHRKNGLLRFLDYIRLASRSMRHGRRQPHAPRPPLRIRRRAKFELGSLFFFSAILFATNPLRFVFWVGIPWLLSMAFLVGINFLQHVGCDPESELEHSRDFTSPIGNWFFFNNGYHTVHHLKPELHWSELPAEHARKIRPFRASTLEEKSLFRFFYQVIKEKNRPNGSPSSSR